MKAKTDKVWGDFVRVRGRYQRSVHLERDAREARSLDGYILTPLVRTLTSRVIEGFAAEVPTRAWSITGPYGTGKSAFALFLSDLLSSSECGSGQARRILERTDPSLSRTLSSAGPALAATQGLVPVLATGERRPLQEVLLRALSEAACRFWSGRGRKPAVVSQVQKLFDRVAAGQLVAVRDVVRAFEKVAQAVGESKQRGRGLVVVLDEAGKVLEHAVLNPERGDLHLLQELGEAAHRSGDHPILFAVLLHQAFDQYAARLGSTERAEWAKVQGRFEDLAFQEASIELLRLIGEAIECEALPKAVLSQAAALAESCARLVNRAGHDAAVLAPLLREALPLHPLATLILGPLFRSRLGQNERSLFAFLSSAEPHGLQAFLGQPLSRGEIPLLYAVDGLFDYVSTSLSGQLHGHLGRQWAQIETALRRLPEGASDLDARVLKAIGLLGVFGDAAGLTASDEALELLFADGSPASKRELRAALDRLRRASLVVFRKFRNGYQLWEGSDLDIDGLVRDALGQVDAPATLVHRLTRVAPPRPLVARRHLLETGTFRFLDLSYVDVAAFDDGLPAVDATADGAILLVVEPSTTARNALIHRLGQPMTWVAADAKPIVVAVPRHVGRLIEVGAELAALEWVQTHTPELHDDLVARREVASRIAEAERNLRSEVVRLLSGEVESVWFHRGQEIEVRSQRELAELASEVCDEAYSRAPHIHNELLNRRHLSSSAAAARRGLMEAMLAKAAEERLGFEGAPPEFSMYRSLLEQHGLHRKRDGVWSFGSPKDRPEGSLRPAWDVIEKTFRQAHEGRVRLTELFDELRRPPVGLKDGVLPVLTLSAYLAWQDEMALYEEGAFVPNVTAAVIERVLRQPDRFELQRLTIKGERAALFGRLAETLQSGSVAASGVLPVVRGLVRAVRDLTDFARRTKTISPRAQAVREALLRAREPAPLLFKELPLACGLEPLSPIAKGDGVAAATFVDELRASLAELQAAYPSLLDLIEEAVRTALHLPAAPAAMRAELSERGARLMSVAGDVTLKAFLIRATDEDMPRDEWLVSLGTLLGGKPPESWHDQDIDQARLAVAQVARRFASMETLVSDPASSAGIPLLRVSVSQPGQAEQERVVPLRTADEPLVESVAAQIRALTQQAAASLPREGIVVALALVVRDMMRDLETDTHVTSREGTT